MNKFVSALLATVAYSKHNLASWTSGSNKGLFSSGGATCATDSTDWSDCTYWGQTYAEGDASISWGLSNYWNDGSS
jgi:hypothetical protein